MRRLLRGFTLTEIIIVVAIISLLTAMGGLVAYQGSREKARDTQRFNDLERIALAAEAFRQEYGRYPDCENGISIEPGGVTKSSGSSCTDGAAFLSYIQVMFGEIPYDPLGPGNTDYFYYYDLNLCGYTASNDTRAVKVFAANMERTPSNFTQVCNSSSGNDGGFLNTTTYGGSKNPSIPHTIILGRYR
jgi:prepilin-type N-terminal cleavage/methylation domain-containing protein